MKKSFTCLFLILLSVQLFAQSRRMNAPQMTREYDAVNLANTPWPMLQNIERELRFLNFEEALLLFENLAAQFPNSPEVLILRAKFKRMMTMNTEAEIDAQMAKSLNPYVADLFGYSGPGGVLNLLSYNPGNSWLALSPALKFDYYHKYLDQQSTAQQYADLELREISKALEFIEQDKLDAAQELLSNLKINLPNSALLQDLIGLLHLKTNDLTKAQLAFSQAISLDSSFAISWYNLGVLAHQQKQLEQAKVYLDQAILLDENLTKVYFERAMVLKEMGDKESALDDYDTIIDKTGSYYPEAIFNRALTKKMAGAYTSSLTDLNKVDQLSANDPELLLNRGNLYLLLNLLPKALDDYTAAIQYRTDYADAYYNRGLAHLIMLHRNSGCTDLMTSEGLGHQQATELIKYFCVN